MPSLAGSATHGVCLACCGWCALPRRPSPPESGAKGRCRVTLSTASRHRRWLICLRWPVSWTVGPGPPIVWFCSSVAGRPEARQPKRYNPCQRWRGSWVGTARAAGCQTPVLEPQCQSVPSWWGAGSQGCLERCHAIWRSFAQVSQINAPGSRCCWLDQSVFLRGTEAETCSMPSRCIVDPPVAWRAQTCRPSRHRWLKYLVIARLSTQQSHAGVDRMPGQTLRVSPCRAG